VFEVWRWRGSLDFGGVPVEMDRTASAASGRDEDGYRSELRTFIRLCKTPSGATDTE